MPVHLTDLTAQQIDVLLANHVKQRHAWQDTLATGLSAIDHHSRRIEQLLEQRGRATR